MSKHEVRFIRFTSGRDIITEVVSETKTTIVLKSAMELLTEVDVEAGKQSLIMYPWFPHGVLVLNEAKLNKKDILFMSPIEKDIQQYYVDECLEIFGDNQVMVDAHVAGAKRSPSSNSNILEFKGFVRNKLVPLDNIGSNVT